MTGASQEHGIRARRGARDVGRRLRRGASMMTAALTVCLLPLSAARAQTPFVPDDWKYGKRQESSTLHYCVDARDPDLPVARKIGAAIATALLLQPREHVIGENVAGESLDNLYQVFLGTCDLYLGFKLIPDAYPEWMKLTRPYYRASYVFAAIDAGWRALADMPKSRAIGATMGTGADLRLIQYLQALTPAERWSRFPMSSDEAALKSAHERHRRHRPGLGPRVMGLATERCRLREAPAAVAQSASGRLGGCRGRGAGERILPAQQCRPGDCRAHQRRHHPVHSGRQQISRDCREMTLDSRSRRMRIDR